MTIHSLHAGPSAIPEPALSTFEAKFRYPLGDAGFFSISHGPDYSRFYRSIGSPAWTYLATASGRVLGSLSLALQAVQMPGADSLLYLGDLKVLPVPDRGRVLRNLAQTALRDQDPPSAGAAYGIVMDGTAATPETYSGRAGIPSFHRCGSLLVLRIPSGSPASSSPDSPCLTAAEPAASASYRALAADRIASLGGDPSLRSRFPPTWLLHPAEKACGRLEDTLQAKRLLKDGTGELLSLHLACFAWSAAASAAQLLRQALHVACRHGFPALFTAIDAQDGPDLLPHLADLPLQISSASIYGLGLPHAGRWILHSSEI